MDLYLSLKFLHVTSAMLWLGGGMALLLLGMLRGTASEPERLLGIFEHVVYLAPRLFLPASIATLVTGLAATVVGGHGWPAWIVLGFGGILVTALLGALKIGPSAKRVLAEAARGGPTVAFPQAQAVLRIVKFDYVLQFGIVFLMVTKPSWDDTVPLATVGIAVLMAALSFLLPPGRRLGMG